MKKPSSRGTPSSGCTVAISVSRRCLYGRNLSVIRYAKLTILVVRSFYLCSLYYGDFCASILQMLADTKIPAHEQYAGILAVYNILGELHASWKKLLTKAYIEYSTLENEYQV